MTLLSEYLRAQADWRREKAQEYPDDARNLRSASALDDLAEFVDDGAEGTDTWTLTILEHQMERCEAGTGVARAGERVARAVSRYCYDSGASRVGLALPSWHHSEFLDALVPDALMDAYDDAGAADASPDEAEHYGLIPEEVEAARDGVMLDSYYFSRRDRSTEPELCEAIKDFRAAQEV